MNSNKRGQAALEFLMTYGWAILVVLVIIGALAYFGVLSPGKLVPERCQIESGINCQDWQLDAGDESVSLVIQNSKGREIVINNLTLDESQGDAVCENISSETTINNGETDTISADCSGLEAGGTRKTKMDLELEWSYERTDLNHTARGQVFANVNE
ncbi:MAG: hypothetical protein ACQEP1_04160 [Nanobdellota archaeon]